MIAKELITLKNTLLGYNKWLNNVYIGHTIQSLEGIYIENDSTEMLDVGIKDYEGNYITIDCDGVGTINTIHIGSCNSSIFMVEYVLNILVVGQNDVDINKATINILNTLNSNTNVSIENVDTHKDSVIKKYYPKKYEKVMELIGLRTLQVALIKVKYSYEIDSYSDLTCMPNPCKNCIEDEY